MAGTPFLGEIRMFSFSFAPQGWAKCNGGLLPINQNQALFAMLGTMYGGNGQTNFALPNLQGRVPMHLGNGFDQGQAGGEAAHTVSIAEMPTHTHFVSGTSAAASTPIPTNNLLANATAGWYAEPTQSLTTLRPETIANTGGSQPHNNLAPYSVTNFCIALQGIFASRT